MIQIKKRIMTIAALSLSAALLSQTPIVSKQIKRVLVLGFDSRQLNDVQDMLLRETVMRRLQTDGFRIVPVMEVESLFYEERKRQIRKLTRDEIQGLCTELRAGVACSGSIAPEDGRADQEITAGKNYICTLLFYRKDRNEFEERRLTVAGGESLYQFFDLLSKKIADEIDSLL